MNRPLALLLVVSLIATTLVLVDRTNSRADDAPSNSELQKTLVQLSEARLKLSETNLQLAQADNKRVPGVVAEVVIARMQVGVAQAKARLANAQGKPEDASIDALVPSAEFAVEILEARIKKLDELIARSGDQLAINQAQVSRAQLEVAKFELASLKLMKGRPIAQQVQWQLNELSAAMDDLHTRVTVLEDKR